MKNLPEEVKQQIENNSPVHILTDDFPIEMNRDHEDQKVYIRLLDGPSAPEDTTHGLKMNFDSYQQAFEWLDNNDIGSVKRMYMTDMGQDVDPDDLHNDLQVGGQTEYYFEQ